MLELKNVKYNYENMHLHFNFKTKKGEITAILGKSGAGKSTLLSLISGFISPNSGDIFINEKSILKEKIEKRDLSILFQENNLFAHMTIFDNIALGINPKLKLTKNEIKQIFEISKKYEIDTLLDRLPNEVSGGQKQRAAIARTVLRKKALLLLDEPFSALDPTLKDEMLGKIKALAKKEQTTIIMVTHSIEDAIKIASNFILIDKGEIILKGNIDLLKNTKDNEILNTYLNIS